jgi:hypothetical protein
LTRQTPDLSNAQRRRWAIQVAVLTALWALGYGVVASAGRRLPAHDVSLGLDRAWPVLPWAVWLYFSAYALPVVECLSLRDGRGLTRMLLAQAWASAAAFFVFLAFPCANPLPHLGQDLSERLLAAQYQWDFYPGANKLPALHIALPALYALALGREGRRGAAAWAWVWVAGIALAALSIRQHVLLDAVAAVPLAWLADLAAGAWLRRWGRPRSGEDAERWRHLGWGLLAWAPALLWAAWLAAFSAGGAWISR